MQPCRWSSENAPSYTFEEAKPVLLAADSGPAFSGNGGAVDGKLDFGWWKKGDVGAGCLKVFPFIGCKYVSITI